MGDVIAFVPRRPRSLATEQIRQGAAPQSEKSAAHQPVTGRPATAGPAVGPEPLWRQVVGAVLRDERRRQHRTLAQVAGHAGMSVQYLSELERGRKEASSEMLAAACGSLGMDLAQFALRCAGAISTVSGRPSGPVLHAA